MGTSEHTVTHRPRPADRTTYWTAVATRVGAQLRARRPSVGQPDRDLGADISLLKAAGLVTVLAATRYGGGGQDWPTACRVLREIASADEHLAHLLGQHFLWSWQVHRVATAEQAEAIEAAATQNLWFFAGALTTRARVLGIRDDNEHLVLNGRQEFTTGSHVSDVTVLHGRMDGTDVRLLAVVPTRHPGLTFHTDADDHDDLRPTTTERRAIQTNGVCVAEVRVSRRDILGLPATRAQPPDGDGLAARVTQLLLANIAIGVVRARIRAKSGGHPERRDQQHERRALAARLRTTEALADQLAAIVVGAARPTAPRTVGRARHLRAVEPAR